MKVSYYALMMLYTATAAWYFVVGGGNPFQSVQVFSPRLYFVPAAVGEILMLDAIGLVLLFKLGPLRSLLSVVAVGGVQLLSWSLTYTFAMPGGLALALRQYSVPRILALEVVDVALTVAVVLYLSRKIVWRITPLFFFFLIYYAVYFVVWHGPYVYGSSIELPAEMGYQFCLNAALLSGFFSDRIVKA